MKIEKIVKNNLVESTTAKSIKDCQKWVDYDLKRYGKISDTTMKFIKDANFVVGRDENGNFEVVKAATEKDIIKAKDLKESISNSPYKNLIAEYFDFSLDFAFLDVVADVIDRVEDFKDTDDIYQAIGDEVIYSSQEWAILKHYCPSAKDANWEQASDEFDNDIIAICNKIAEVED